MIRRSAPHPAILAAALFPCVLANAANGLTPIDPPLVPPPPSNAPPGSSGTPAPNTAPPTPGTASPGSATNPPPSNTTPPTVNTGNTGANTPPPPPTASAVQTTSIEEPPFSFSGGYIHQFDSNLKGGGNFGADRFYASFSARLVTTQDFTLTLGMGYEFDWYHFDVSPQPFTDVNLFALQLRAKWKLSEEFAVGLGGIFGVAGETDADVGDSIYGGGIASVMWTPSETLMLGVGLLGVTQIADDPLVIPVPIVHWKITDEWVLSSVRRPPASPFVGIDVAWEPLNSPLDVALGFAWQTRRFRLGPNSLGGGLSRGVGQDEGFAMLFSLGYDFCKDIRLDILTGFNFDEELEIARPNGTGFTRVDVSPSAMLGAFLTFKF